jgi:hypothetical protein
LHFFFILEKKAAAAALGFAGCCCSAEEESAPATLGCELETAVAGRDDAEGGLTTATMAALDAASSESDFDKTEDLSTAASNDEASEAPESG